MVKEDGENDDKVTGCRGGRIVEEEDGRTKMRRTRTRWTSMRRHTRRRMEETYNEEEEEDIK